ncbi:unnamed protein product [Gadus morhua 'NCC']
MNPISGKSKESSRGVREVVFVTFPQTVSCPRPHIPGVRLQPMLIGAGSLPCGFSRAQRALGPLSGTAAAADTPRCPPPRRIGLADVGRRGSDWWETERK